MNLAEMKVSNGLSDNMAGPVYDVSAKGTIGYNQKTKILAIAETNSSYQTRIHVYRNIEAPDSYSSEYALHDAMVNVETSPYFINPPSSSGNREHKERGVVTVCDDGTIYVNKMIPSSGVYAIRFTVVDGSYEPDESEVYRDTWTTTYGIDNGNSFGIRHNITKDQKKVMNYSPTYYYGTGIYLMVIDVETGDFIYYSEKASAYSYQPIPFMGDKIILSYSMNSDGGQGASFFYLDLEKIFYNAIPGTLQTLPSRVSRIFDVGYQSTNYSYMVPIPCKDISKFK
jgi:hypothetical protein